MSIPIRVTKDGRAIDEIVAPYCGVHIEAMDNRVYHMNITTSAGTVAFCIKGTIKEVWRDE